MKKSSTVYDNFQGYPVHFRQAMHLIAGVLLRIAAKRKECERQLKTDIPVQHGSVYYNSPRQLYDSSGIHEAECFKWDE